MALTREEREEFLAQPHIAALSVNAEDARGPLTVPIWYQYTPGGEPWVLTGVASRKTRLIEAAGYFSLMVDRSAPTARYVAVDGPVNSQVVIAMKPQHWLSADLGEA
jgi:nitroimidazol reductase NimA-like FMN-containing flavoprotein (pyridoxamine 5'-phosphate oxidase superfamily)